MRVNFDTPSNEFRIIVKLRLRQGTQQKPVCGEFRREPAQHMPFMGGRRTKEQILSTLIGMGTKTFSALVIAS
jgi:hypothetical protein